MLSSKYQHLSDSVKNSLQKLQDAESSFRDMIVRVPAIGRAVMEARIELSERFRHMQHCLYKVATCRVITGEVAAPTDDQDVELSDLDELRFYLEAFYNAAWRVHRIMSFLTGEKIPYDGVNMVRNKLIEHTHDKDPKLSENPLFTNSIGLDSVAGPKLKGFRWDEHAADDWFHDKGLYVNAAEFLEGLTGRLRNMS